MRRSGVILALASLLVGASAATASVAGAQTSTTATSSSSATKSVLDQVTVKAAAGAGSTAPVLVFKKPLSVKTSTHKVLDEGTGDALTAGEFATVDFVETNARTGRTVRTSYGSTPQRVQLDTTSGVPSLIEGLLATKIGGQVLVAVAPKDYAAKLHGAVKGVKKNDTLLFLMAPTKASPARAVGTPVPPVDGLPTVALDAAGKPTITVPAGVAAPTSLVVQPLIKGDGPVVRSGQTVVVHYTGIVYGTGKQFDSSWDRGQPATFPIGKGQVIPGWHKGIVGQTVGSQLLLVIPPADGYGTNGNSQAGITGTDTLVFVVDILDAY